MKKVIFPLLLLWLSIFSVGVTIHDLKQAGEQPKMKAQIETMREISKTKMLKN
ncbi:hypothetical protein GNP80_05520 [Aliivibrio fischeri]|uniref:hypothetical protein n=1 Tax=Aliivibrio fischeri TaxID=668 RepID=UPI0012D936EF|nr:hypothetical protein [Aliivibrio fischeri]MUK91894.1 hypothetical protein [Aliivibrio fischeri]